MHTNSWNVEYFISKRSGENEFLQATAAIWQMIVCVNVSRTTAISKKKGNILYAFTVVFISNRDSFRSEERLLTCKRVCNLQTVHQNVRIHCNYKVTISEASSVSTALDLLQ